MIFELAANFASAPTGDAIFLAGQTGEGIANEVRTFVAPLAALIIGVMGIRYLVGDQRSLAGFIGFLLLGVVVYALIAFGDGILESLGGIFEGWIA